MSLLSMFGSKFCLELWTRIPEIQSIDAYHYDLCQIQKLTRHKTREGSIHSFRQFNWFVVCHSPIFRSMFLDSKKTSIPMPSSWTSRNDVHSVMASTFGSINLGQCKWTFPNLPTSSDRNKYEVTNKLMFPVYFCTALRKIFREKPQVVQYASIGRGYMYIP